MLVILHLEACHENIPSTYVPVFVINLRFYKENIYNNSTSSFRSVWYFTHPSLILKISSLKVALIFLPLKRTHNIYVKLVYTFIQVIQLRLVWPKLHEVTKQPIYASTYDQIYFIGSTPGKAYIYYVMYVM